MNLAGGQSMAMYENDEIDITGVGLFDLDRILDPAEELNKELVVAPPDFSISYVGFNASEPPFDDPKFRKALTHAVNKELIATEVLSELVEPATGYSRPDSLATTLSSLDWSLTPRWRDSFSRSQSTPTPRRGPESS